MWTHDGCVGLARHDAVLFLPLYSALLIVASTIMGGVFYQEFHCFSFMDSLVFPIGIIVIAVGMTMLGHRMPSSEYEQHLVDKDDAMGSLERPNFRQPGSCEAGPFVSGRMTTHHLLSTTLVPTILKPGTPRGNE